MRNHLDLALASLADLDGVAKVASAALDLDAVVEELLEGGGIEDLVVDGLGAVDDVLYYAISISFLLLFAFVCARRCLGCAIGRWRSYLLGDLSSLRTADLGGLGSGSVLRCAKRKY